MVKQQIPEKTDILIIGAGIIGSSIFYWLKQLGYDRKILIIDRNSYGNGNSSKAAGIMTIQLPHVTDSWLVKESQEFYSQFGSVSGGIEHPKFVKTGFLTTAGNEKKVEYLEKKFSSWKKVKPETTLLSPAEIKKLSPSIDEKQVELGVYTPTDAFGSGNDWSNWFIRRTRDQEQFFSKAYEEVVGFKETNEGILIYTSTGNKILSHKVIIATGAWSKKLVNKLDLSIPLKSYRAKALSIEAFEGSNKLVPHHDLDTGAYFKREVNGNVVVGDGTEHFETDPDNIQRQPPLEFLEHLSSILISLYPASQSSGIMNFWSGHCQATPDTYPLLGSHPEKKIILLATGFQGIGIMRGAAIGKIMAEYTITGKKSSKLTDNYWIDRFHNFPNDFPIQEGFQL